MADCDRCLEGREKGLESDGIADSHAQNTAPTKPGTSHKRSYIGDAITLNRTEEDMGFVRFPLRLPASTMTAFGTKRAQLSKPAHVRFRSEADISRASGAFRSDENDPNVWSGRALQEDFSEFEGCGGLASMYPAFDWSLCAPGHHGYQRACDLISG